LYAIAEVYVKPKHRKLTERTGEYYSFLSCSIGGIFTISISLIAEIDEIKICNAKDFGAEI